MVNNMELGYLKYKINEILDNHSKLIYMVKNKIPDVVINNLVNDVRNIKNILEIAKKQEEKGDNK